MRIKMLYEQRHSGFTLIETLIYIAIFSMLVGAFATFALSINSSRLRTQDILEVNEQGAGLVRIITQSIRNTETIGTPSVGESGEMLIVGESDPTIFSLNNGTMFVEEGTSPAIALTNNKVKVSNLVFSNLSRPLTPGVVQIRFTLSNIPSSTQGGRQYSVDFYGTAAIR